MAYLYKQKDDIVDFTVTADTLVGDIVPLGASRVGMATLDALAGEKTSLRVAGVLADVPALTTEAFVEGSVVYWDDTAKVATLVSTDNTPMGICVEEGKLVDVVGTIRVLIG